MTGTAFPFKITLSPATSHLSSPGRGESCRARRSVFPNRSAQIGASMQWEDPVTKSSGMP